MYWEAARIDIGTGKNCLFCTANCYWHEDPHSLSVLFICPTCGKYQIAYDSVYYLRSPSADTAKLRYKVSFFLRSAAEIATGKQDSSLFPVYTYGDIMEMIERIEPSVQEKLLMLLKYFGKITEYPGQEILFDTKNDYSVVCAKNLKESRFYFETLVKQGYLHRPTITQGDQAFTMTATGWNELSRLSLSGSDSSNAFIAMSFHSSRDVFEKAISAAVRGAGYSPIRVDKLEHINRIDDEIISRIRNSKFLIAAFTQQRNGVYFEAGFMLGLGRPVIWICEKADLQHVHFDTRQYNTIDYLNADDLRTRLQFRIEAILGKGPQAST